ncbi:MAG TPA: hypothetical protein VFU89_07730 [Rhabdochlamydiaceae bacterium]|nr:hypothetical protein [Rhabdochlamydiaceae bacterium]
MIPYKDLFANQADALQDQPLVQSLCEMDLTEYKIVRAESDELNNYTYPSPVRRIAGLFALIMFGMFAGIYLRGQLSRYVSLWDGVPFDFMVSTWISAFFFALVGEKILFYDRQRLENKIDEISLKRRERLEAKVSQLKNQLDKAKINSVSYTELSQLSAAHGKINSNLNRHSIKKGEEAKKDS